jgi:hypothetical protein
MAAAHCVAASICALTGCGKDRSRRPPEAARVGPR